MLDTVYRLDQSGLAHAGKRPLAMLRLSAALIVMLILGLDAGLIYHTREIAISAGEINLANTSRTLSEQADQTFRSLDLILSNIAEHIAVQGIDSDAALAEKMGGNDTHLLLSEKLSGVPQVDDVAIINSQGNLINSSRHWPLLEVNVSDRNYFRALSASSDLATFVSAPLRNRVTGTWTIFLARRITGPDGRFIGLVLGAMRLDYFEQFFKSVLPGDDAAISLLRTDGVLEARYPHSDEIGGNFGGQRVLGFLNGIIRDISPIDGKMRVKAAHALANYPLLILVTDTEQSMLLGWLRNLIVLAGIGVAGALGVILAALVAARWWRQQQNLAMAEAGKANAERAHALAEAELLRQRELAAEATSRAKSNFLAVMSHEIRTPMNAVLGLASMLLESELDPEQRKAVSAIQESGDNLLQILNDILDLSKIEAGKVDLELLPFSPEALARTVANIVGPRAHSKHLSLRLEIAPDAPLALVGDAGRIRQVLLNLISNAVKFTTQGEVFVGLRCIAQTDTQATIEWTVRDSGIGIAPERIGQLFTEFVQADSSIMRRFGGTGLGLAICKQLTEQMQGEIGIASTLGEGSTFTVRLTLPKAGDLATPRQDNAAEVSRELKARIAAIGRPLEVLIAEDNPTNQYVVASMLKDFDIHATIVGDGTLAVDAVTRTSFDMVFMDVRMPEMDGFEATRAIRARGGPFATLPIIGFTANAFPENVKECKAAGMQQVVAKPVRKATFLAAILDGLAFTV